MRCSIASLVAFGLLLLVTLFGACGGSSSETPPPLAPDPEKIREVQIGDSIMPEGKAAAGSPSESASESVEPEPQGSAGAPNQAGD